MSNCAGPTARGTNTPWKELVYVALCKVGHSPFEYQGTNINVLMSVGESSQLDMVKVRKISKKT